MADFCVYLTVYRGNKLPPFYIGSTSVNKIENGYRGSVSSKQYKDVWKGEPNHLFHTYIISLHETRTEAMERESQLQSKLKADCNPLYVNRAIYRNGHLYRNWTKEERQRQSAIVKGRKRPDVSLYNASRQLSDDTKKKMSSTRKQLIKSGAINVGQTWSEEDKLNNSRSQSPQRLYQFSLDGELIHTWESVYVASSKLGVNRGSLRTRALQGRKYKNYIWKMENKL